MSATLREDQRRIHSAKALGKAERTRLRLISAVREALERQGGFTAESVARQAGSSTATFYNHFPSKEAALLAAFSTTMDELVGLLAEELRIERVLDLGLQGFAHGWVRRAAEFFRENAGVFRSAQVALPQSRQMRDVFRSHEEAALIRYERFVQLGQAARVIRPDERSALAQALMIVSEGWNHPRVFNMEEGGTLHGALAAVVVRMLDPSHEAGPAGSPEVSS